MAYKLCPKCGSDEIDVEIATVVRVQYDAATEDLEVVGESGRHYREINGDSAATCPRCGWHGSVYSLTRPAKTLESDLKRIVLNALAEYFPELVSDLPFDNLVHVQDKLQELWEDMSSGVGEFGALSRKSVRIVKSAYISSSCEGRRMPPAWGALVGDLFYPFGPSREQVERAISGCATVESFQKLFNAALRIAD